MNLAALLYFFQVLWAVPNVIFSHGSTRSTSQFEVHSLPDSPTLPSSWAGRLPVPGTKDGNAIFFWLFEAGEQAYNDNLISQFVCRAQEVSTLTESQSGSMVDLAVPP